MNWTLEDNMVDGFFFFTAQAAEEAIPHLCRQERKRPTPVWGRVGRTPAVLGGSFQEGVCRCLG